MNKPARSFKHKGINVAVWRRDDGSESYSISKQYKDKNTGEWKDSRYWFKEEVIQLMNMLQEAVSETPAPSAIIREVPPIEDEDIPF